MFQRENARHELAKKVCSLPYSRLFEWGISRVADVTGLDTIGLPIYTACRPPGEAITISAGKGLTKQESMTGAILEAVELWASEHPERHTDWAYCSHNTAVKSFKNVMPFGLFQLAKDATVNPNTPISFEEMNDLFRDEKVVVPSDMIWLKPRKKPPFLYFQGSSSGQASGVNLRDANLQALYEAVERDGWAISEFLQEHTGQWRQCVSLDCQLPPSVKFCVDRIRAVGVRLYLFDLTTDIGVPIFRCTILDDNPECPGAFSGFGCSLDPVTSARRAITEACQGRVVYLAGGRDDLMRRRFLLLKNVTMDPLIELYESLPQTSSFSRYSSVVFTSIEEEWESLTEKVKKAGINEVYSKTLYESIDPVFSVVKVVCPEMECPFWEFGPPGKRSLQALVNLTECLT